MRSLARFLCKIFAIILLGGKEDCHTGFRIKGQLYFLTIEKPFMESTWYKNALRVLAEAEESKAD